MTLDDRSRTEPDADRPDLVLVPGLLNDADLWRDQVEALSDLRRIWIADITRRDTMRALAEDVLGLVDGTFALAGFSLGGYVAQEVLRIAPERVERLALIGTTFRPDSPERIAQRRAVNAGVALPGRFHGFGDRLVGAYLHPDHRGEPRYAERVRAMTERLGPDVLVRQNNLDRVDGTDVLRRLRCPVLIMCGDRDAITPPAESRAMAALVPHARLVQVPGSGHLAPIEDAAFVSREMRDWLSGV